MHVVNKVRQTFYPPRSRKATMAKTPQRGVAAPLPKRAATPGFWWPFGGTGSAVGRDLGSGGLWEGGACLERLQILGAGVAAAAVGLLRHAREMSAR